VIAICESGKPQAQIKSEQTRDYKHAVAQLVTANDDAPAAKPASAARQAFRP